MFTGDRGRPLRRSRCGEIWRQAAKAAELLPKTENQALRHFHESLLKVVQDWRGHALVTETLNTYAHIWPDSEDRTRSAVDAVLGASASPVRDTRSMS